jgi:hypothetical protein
MKLTEEQLAAIAAEVHVGMNCYVGLKDGGIHFAPDPSKPQPEEVPEEWQEMWEKYRRNSSRYAVIAPMPPSQAFRVMFHFTELEGLNAKVRKRLREALNSGKPMSNFNNLIRQYQVERQAWQLYKDQQNLAWVRREASKLNLLNEE